MIRPDFAHLQALDRQGDQSTTMSAALRLAEQCRYDADHAHHVGRLALSMFDDLRPLHGYGPDERFILHLAAVLHDIGHIGGSAGHHKRSLSIILSATDLGLDEPTRLVLACVARYHRKALPKQGHVHFSLLDPSARRQVEVLSALLRVADALDAGHECLVTQVSAAATPRSILLDCQTRDIERVHQVILPIGKANLLERISARRVCCLWQER